MSTTEIAVVEPILEIDQPQPSEDRKTYLCRHIFVDGRRCGSRALRNQNFCYYHYAHRTPVLANQRPRKSASGFDLIRLDSLDNHTSIQLSLADVLGRIANNTLDPRRAWLLLYGLQIAGHNLRHAHPTPPAPIPEAIVEDAAHGQLAEPEPGRPQPQSLHNRMQALLRADPNANLSALADNNAGTIPNDAGITGRSSLRGTGSAGPKTGRLAWCISSQVLCPPSHQIGPGQEVRTVTGTI